MQDYFHDSVRHSVGVVGINTSAMIDALVLDKPCIGLITDRYQATQMRAQHFRHLLASGAMSVAKNAEECLCQLEALADGVDEKVSSRRAFVEEFVRPRGRDVAAGELAAAAVIRLGSGTPPKVVAAMSPAQILDL